MGCSPLTDTTIPARTTLNTASTRNDHAGPASASVRHSVMQMAFSPGGRILSGRASDQGRSNHDTSSNIVGVLVYLLLGSPTADASTANSAE